MVILIFAWIIIFLRVRAALVVWVPDLEAMAVFATNTVFVLSEGEFSLLLLGRSVAIWGAAWISGLEDLEVNFVERVPCLGLDLLNCGNFVGVGLTAWFITLTHIVGTCP